MKDWLGARVRLLIIIFLIILPALLVLLFIKKYAVNVSMWDDLTFVPLIGKLYAGHLSFGDLFAQHNEHRQFFPYLLMLLLGVTTHYNTIVECYFSWFFICLMGYVFFRCHIRAFGKREIALLTLVPIVWLIFTPRQLGNLLWGYMLAIFVVVFFFLLAIYLLATSKGLGWRFAFAIVSGVISTFSMGNGMLVWPIGFIMILWTRQSQTGELRRLYLKMCYVWCLICIASILAYFVGYHSSLGSYPMEYSVQHPLSSLAYFVKSIGNLFTVPASLPNVANYLPYVMGLLLLFLYIYAGSIMVCQTKARPYTVVSLSLILFVLLSLLMATVERTFLGVVDAMRDRHSTVAIIGMVGLYMAMISLSINRMTVKTFLKWGPNRIFVVSLAFVVIVGIAISYQWGIAQGSSHRSFSNLNSYYLSTYKVQSDANLWWLFPWDTHTARESAMVLEKYKLNVFSRPSLTSEELTLVQKSTPFHVDSINNCTLSGQNACIINLSDYNETLIISGWAVDQEAKNAAGGVFVSMDGKIDIPALYGLDRPDVAQALHNARYKSSGFLASFATAVLGEGQHVVSLKIVTFDKKGYYEPDQNILVDVK